MLIHTVDLYKVLNAITTGDRWHPLAGLPSDFPPWQMTYIYGRNQHKDGTEQRIPDQTRWLAEHDSA